MQFKTTSLNFRTNKRQRHHREDELDDDNAMMSSSDGDGVEDDTRMYALKKNVSIDKQISEGALKQQRRLAK